MAKKLLLIILTFISMLYVHYSFSNANESSYIPYIPKGSLIKVYTKTPITTEHLELGSKVYFIVPSDVWVIEKKIISKGEIFIGEVSMLKMPIQGINAAMSITITDIVNPKTKERTSLKGKIIFSGSDVLGGNLTNPASYNTTIHPRRVYGNHWGGTLQYVPSGEYEFGQHVGVNQRDALFVQLEEDYYI